jgi:ABC-type polysaccharide/polyol phosphate transport system ATPase subunit
VFADRVSKTFEIPREHVHTFKEKALHPFRRTGHHTLHALEDVSFSVGAGEFFGIVGRNGSGKSTLLKCLAGIYGTDSGRIVVDGRMSTFIELGVGFNMDLAAQDNVVLNATMLGLSTREARRRYDRIIDFAELREFSELKLKNYSSGMLVRLAFAVMIQVDAEILLIDEVLAVGDAAFQQKCYDEFARIRRSGATVILVTHDMSAVQRFCDRALLLEHGRRVDLGEPERVGGHYLQLNFSAEGRDESAAAADDQPEERFGDGRAEILEAWFEDEYGQSVKSLPTHRPCAFRARVRFHERLCDPLFGFDLYNSAGTQVWAASNVMGPESGVFEAGEEVVFTVRFQNLLAPDRYWATPAVARANGGVEWHDRQSRLTSVVVTATRQVHGVVDLPFEVEVERSVQQPGVAS